MSTDPLTLMRAIPDKPWVRIGGVAKPCDPLEHYIEVAAMCEPGNTAQ
jgi:hypothetical protein